MINKRRMPSAHLRRRRQSARNSELDLYKALCPKGDYLDNANHRDFMAFIKRKGWELYQEDCMNRKRQAEEFLRAISLSIPSPKRGEPYSYTAELPPIEIGKSYFIAIDVPGITARYIDGQLQICGEATETGIYRLQLTYAYNHFIGVEGQVYQDYPIEVLQNPRDLWSDIPTSFDIPYYKADRDSAYERGKKNIVAASQRGRSHAHEGKPRDDHFSIAYDETSGWHILAVADGAGSATFSREGSRIACESVRSYCLEALADANNPFEQSMQVWSDQKDDIVNKKRAHTEAYNLLGKAAFIAFKKIEQEAARKGEPIKLYATTLLLSVCKKTDRGWFIASFWVGDGAIGLYDRDKGKLHLMGMPDGGEYAGQTRFLTNSEIFTEAINRIRIDIVNDFTALMLMSDGITDPKFETDANLQNIEYWNKLWEDIGSELRPGSESEAQYQLLKWMDFWSRGNHDDRTLAMIY